MAFMLVCHPKILFRKKNFQTSKVHGLHFSALFALAGGPHQSTGNPSAVQILDLGPESGPRYDL